MNEGIKGLKVLVIRIFSPFLFENRDDKFCKNVKYFSFIFKAFSLIIYQVNKLY